jgi:hypothetical protein
MECRYVLYKLHVVRSGKMGLGFRFLCFPFHLRLKFWKLLFKLLYINVHPSLFLNLHFLKIASNFYPATARSNLRSTISYKIGLM